MHSHISPFSKLEIYHPHIGLFIKSLSDYTTVIRPDDNGTFVAYVPAISGCHAWGFTTDNEVQFDQGRIKTCSDSVDAIVNLL